MPKNAKYVNELVGTPRYHAAYHGKTAASVKVGPASKTSSPKIPKPACGSGKGFKGI